MKQDFTVTDKKQSEEKAAPIPEPQEKHRHTVATPRTDALERTVADLDERVAKLEAMIFQN